MIVWVINKCIDKKHNKTERVPIREPTISTSSNPNPDTHHRRLTPRPSPHTPNNHMTLTTYALTYDPHHTRLTTP